MNDQTIQMIAQAIIANTEVLSKLIDKLSDHDKARVGTPVAAQITPPTPVPAPIAAPAPVVQASAAPVAAPAPAAVVQAPAAPVMPPVPTFQSAPVVQAAQVPFNDGRSLIAYVMDAYGKMGAEKGALIQKILTDLGYDNINDVKPEHYLNLFQGVEALKNS